MTIPKVPQSAPPPIQIGANVHEALAVASREMAQGEFIRRDGPTHRQYKTEDLELLLFSAMVRGYCTGARIADGSANQ